MQFTQIEECIKLSLFAIDMQPRNPPLEVGEELLLQLVKGDADRLGKLDSRIEFALIFERLSEDRTGAVSRQHWPDADKTWRYILHCSETIPTIPFSLERLNLSRDYGGRMNAMHIEPEDEAKIRPYLKSGGVTATLSSLGRADALLVAIRNYDRVFRLSPVKATRVSEHERRLRDPWLGDTLKTFYEHRCQVCTHDFKPRYGVPYADTRFITPLEQGGDPISVNLLVLCPNHNAIVPQARAIFDPHSLAFRFPNGLTEKLVLRDHLLSAS